eukprot:tig00020927_g15993.t1
MSGRSKEQSIKDATRKEIRDELDELKTIWHREAKAVVTDSFPQKILQLTRLISSEQFKCSPFDPPVHSEGSGEHQHSKKRKADHDGAEPTKDAVPVNEGLSEIARVVKSELRDIIALIAKVKIFIQTNIPRMEDGGNFGVECQQEIVAELTRAEDSTFSVLEGVNKYYMARGKLTSKVIKYPGLSDYTQSVRELDEKEFLNYKLAFVDLRNTYAILYDLLVKNWDRLVAPRSSHAHAVLY